ncbi:MAG: alpha/beta hydrolase [Alphaproteobacteria bacterium]
MSLRAEFVRLGLRWFLKPTSRPDVTITRRREQIGNFQRWVPPPPKEAEIARGMLGGLPALYIATPQSRPDRQILFLHGGGYVTGSPDLYVHLLWRIAAAAAARIAAVQYRLAPEHPFPAALDDALAAWRGLLEAGADPRRSAFIGDSAGGGLVLALALRARDTGEKLPAAIVAMSPWTDLAVTGASVCRNARADPMLNAGDVPYLASRYLAGADPRHPYASPLYGDPSGLPPTLIQVGGDEILLDDSVRMAARMREAGVDIRLEIWPRMPHVFQSFSSILPEARRAIGRIGAFVRAHAGVPD